MANPASPRETKRGLKQLAYEFIMNNRAAALATVDEQGRPHVAIVYCVAHKDLSLYFSTRVEGRKYNNLVHQKYVAMSIYNRQRMQTIQLTGTAKRVEKLDIEQEVLLELMKLRYRDPNWELPPLQLFNQGASNEIAVIKVVPKEMTFANFKTKKAGRYRAVFRRIIGEEAA